MKLTKFFLLLILVCFAMPASAEKIKLGIIAPFTGPLADVGPTLKLAVEHAQKDLDKGDLLEIIVEDDQYIPRQSVTAAQKLINVDRVKALIVFGTPPTIAVTELAERAGILTFGLTLSTKTLDGKKHVFRFFPSMESQIKILLKELEIRNYENIAIVHTENEAMAYASDMLRKELRTPILFDEGVALGESNMRALEIKVRQKKPAAIFIPLLPPSAVAFARELKASGYSGELFGILTLSVQSELKRSAGVLNNVWFSGTDDTRAKKLKEEILRQNKDSYSPDGALAYDIVGLFLQTIKQGTDWPGILRETTSYEGLFGTATKEKGSNLFSSAVVLMQINGEDYAPMLN